MKNIKNQDEEKMYTSSRSERIHRKYAGSKWDDDYFTPGKTAHHWIARFIDKHIGKSYDNTYSEFCSAIKDKNRNNSLPMVVDGVSLKDLFKNMFAEPYPSYRVQNDVILKIPHKSYHQKTRYIYTYPEGHKYRYTLDDKYRDSIEFKDMFITYFGYHLYDRLLEHLCEDEMYVIVDTIHRNFYYNDWFRKKYTRYYEKSTDIFTKIDLAPCIKTPYTKEMRKKTKAEGEDYIRKVRRENLQKKEEILSELLNRIESERKKVEAEKNRIDVERLGFDEKTSFRGEIYHGQKRKKRK